MLSVQAYRSTLHGAVLNKSINRLSIFVRLRPQLPYALAGYSVKTLCCVDTLYTVLKCSDIPISKSRYSFLV